MATYKARRKAQPISPDQSSMFEHAAQVQSGTLRSHAPNLNPDPKAEQMMLIGEAQTALGLCSPIPILLWGMRDHAVRLVTRIYQGRRVMVIPVSDVEKLRISTRLSRALAETKAIREGVLV